MKKAKQSRNSKFHFSRTVLWFFLIINIASMVSYQFGNMRNDFYHEAAFPLLYAKDILDSRVFFSSDFSGREISPISWPIVYALLLLVGFDTSLATVGIANVLFLLFSLVVLIWFGNTFKVKKTNILLALVLYTTPWGMRPFKYSWVDQVWIWPMNSYGIYELFSLILCIFAFKMMTDVKTIQKIRVFCYEYKYCLLVFFLFGLNHNRGLLEIYGPVGFTIFSLSLYSYFNDDEHSFRRNVQVFFATFLATLLGRILIGILTSGVPQYWQQPSQNFTTLDQSNFPGKLLSPILTIFQVFGLNPSAGNPVLSFQGIRQLSLIVIVLFLVFLPVVKYLKSGSFEKLTISGKFMFLHLLYFVVVSFMTSLLTNSSGVIRYSIPLAISAIFFVPFVFSENLKKQVALTLVLILALVPNIFSGAYELNRPVDSSYKQSLNYQLMDSLLERNLVYGYAGPWTEDVLVIPFYSNGKIHVSLIDVAPIGPHLHADKSWFRESSHTGETFVAIPTELVAKEENLQQIALASASRYEVNKWTVLVFDDNPAELIGKLD